MVSDHVQIAGHPDTHATETTNNQRLLTLSVVGLNQLVRFLLAQGVMDQCFQDIACNRAGKAVRFRPGHSAINDFTLTGIVPQWRPGLQFVLANGGDNSLAFSDQIDDSAVNFIQALPQFQQFVSGQWQVWFHKTYLPPQLIDQATISASMLLPVEVCVSLVK